MLRKSGFLFVLVCVWKQLFVVLMWCQVGMGYVIVVSM